MGAGSFDEGLDPEKHVYVEATEAVGIDLVALSRLPRGDRAYSLKTHQLTDSADFADTALPKVVPCTSTKRAIPLGPHRGRFKNGKALKVGEAGKAADPGPGVEDGAGT